MVVRIGKRFDLPLQKRISKPIAIQLEFERLVAHDNPKRKTRLWLNPKQRFATDGLEQRQKERCFWIHTFGDREQQKVPKNFR